MRGFKKMPYFCSIMVQIFQTRKGLLQELDQLILPNGSWVNIIDPSAEERKWIIENTPIIEEYLTEALDLDEQSRVEREDDCLLIVIRIPHFKGIESDMPFTTVPILIVIAQNQIFTICKEDNIIVQEFIKQRIRGFSTGKKNKFLLQFMLKTASKFLVHLRNINKNVEALEDELENSLRNKELMALLKYEKVLIYYTTALKTNEAMMERLQRMRIFAAYEEDEELLEDVLIENKQAMEMTNITQKVLAQMTGAYSSIINNNVNYVIKFLTLVTICLSIPTLLASLYGMNIPLPGQQSENAIFYMLSISIVFIAFTVLFFKMKKWF